MPVGLLGRKIGMTQVYDEAGVVIPVTVIEAGPCTVLLRRTKERDGYEAVQLGFGQRPRNKVGKALRGQVASISSKRQQRLQAAGVPLRKKAECEPPRWVREFRIDGESCNLDVGDQVTVSIFENVPYVDVIGTSKGRGTAGVMKRHGFAGLRASHGVKRVHRHPGSIGQSADPSRVLKGTRMAGRYGNSRVTVRHLKVVQINPDLNLLVVKGAVPGPNGGFLMIRETNKR